MRYVNLTLLPAMIAAAFAPANSSGFVQTCVTNGRIVFASDRDGNYEIYTMNADGSDVQRLTDNEALDLDPSWSPDGTRIAFASEEKRKNFNIYMMDVDGSNKVNISTQEATKQMTESFSKKRNGLEQKGNSADARPS